MSEAMVAQCSAPASEPANSAFLRLSAIGLMDRSTVVEPISIRPSSMKRVKPSRRDKA
jgi:hypothetical protein